MNGERNVFVMTLVEGQELEYQRRHDEIWPEMEEALLRSGYRDYTIHRNGRTVVGVAHMVPDAATAGAKMATEPVTERWNESFVGVIEINEDGEYGTTLPQIWRLDEAKGKR